MISNVHNSKHALKMSFVEEINQLRYSLHLLECIRLAYDNAGRIGFFQTENEYNILNGY